MCTIVGYQSVYIRTHMYSYVVQPLFVCMFVCVCVCVLLECLKSLGFRLSCFAQVVGDVAVALTWTALIVIVWCDQYHRHYACFMGFCLIDVRVAWFVCVCRLFHAQCIGCFSLYVLCDVCVAFGL